MGFGLRAHVLAASPASPYLKDPTSVLVIGPSVSAPGNKNPQLQHGLCDTVESRKLSSPSHNFQRARRSLL